MRNLNPPCIYNGRPTQPLRPNPGFSRANSHPLSPFHLRRARPGPGSVRGLDVVRKEAWSFYRTISDVRLCWELEEPHRPHSLPFISFPFVPASLASGPSAVACGACPCDPRPAAPACASTGYEPLRVNRLGAAERRQVTNR